MIVALGSRPYDGPWGGGNRFIAELCDALARRGHAVAHDLNDRDIDIILLTDPRVRSPHVCFEAGAILRYLLGRNPNAIVVHRVNECDERKGEAFINHRLVRANYVADATVFVGEWLTRLRVWREKLREPWYVIRNGSNPGIFDRQGFTPYAGDGPLKLVTHHWGYHAMKGFDVYAALDRLLTEPKWRDRLTFTYVGNLPKGFTFANARYIPPMDGAPLSAELRSHHAYITASINEPGGNHQNEGALCGLPLLYRQSGCMPEYCTGFGVPFDGPGDLEAALERLLGEYNALAGRMSQYPHRADRMTREWIDLFEDLVSRREEIVARRRLWRNPWLVLRNQIPV